MLHTSKTRFVSLLGALNYVAKVGTIEYDVARVHVICIYTCHYYIAGFADDVLHMTYKSSIK